MEKYYDKTCKCGCGQQMIIREYHRFKGIPEYLTGHRNKGKKFSKKHKKNLSLALKGKYCGVKSSWYNKKHSKETKRKMSLSKFGDKNPRGMLRRNHSKETRKKISLSNVGHKVSKSTRMKISVKQKGHKMSEKHKRKFNFNRCKHTRLSKEKIRLSKIGKPRSEKTKKKISFNLIGKYVGEKNPMWRGGLSFEPYSKDFNRSFKNKIRNRDNQVCMVCGVHREKISRAFDVHHVNYDKLLSVPQNCVSLCVSCHMKTNINRNHWTKFFQSLLTEKYYYEYEKTGEIIMEIKE